MEILSSSSINFIFAFFWKADSKNLMLEHKCERPKSSFFLLQRMISCGKQSFGRFLRIASYSNIDSIWHIKPIVR